MNKEKLTDSQIQQASDIKVAMSQSADKLNFDFTETSYNNDLKKVCLQCGGTGIWEMKRVMLNVIVVSEQARLYDSNRQSSTTDLHLLGFRRLSWILRFCIILVSTIYKRHSLYIPLTHFYGKNFR